jgi:hypothetical protein
MCEKTPRLWLRVVAALSICTTGLLLLLNILMSIGAIDFQIIDNLQTANAGVETFVALFSVVGPFAVMALWVLMLYHWGTHEFTSPAQKKLWLAVLLLGNIVTSPIHYFIVVEMRRTVRQAGEGGEDAKTVRE